MAKSGQIMNTSDLRKMLIETIDGVRKGSIEPQQASAIARLSTQILQSAKLDLDVMKFNIANKELELTAHDPLKLIS
jgi:hypothetical protein